MLHGVKQHRQHRTHLPSGHILHDLLLALEGGNVPAVRVAVLLGENGGDEVDARPGAFAGELAVG